MLEGRPQWAGCADVMPACIIHAQAAQLPDRLTPFSCKGYQSPAHHACVMCPGNKLLAQVAALVKADGVEAVQVIGKGDGVHCKPHSAFVTSSHAARTPHSHDLHQMALPRRFRAAHLLSRPGLLPHPALSATACTQQALSAARPPERRACPQRQAQHAAQAVAAADLMANPLQKAVRVLWVCRQLQAVLSSTAASTAPWQHGALMCCSSSLPSGTPETSCMRDEVALATCITDLPAAAHCRTASRP